MAFCILPRLSFYPHPLPPRVTPLTADLSLSISCLLHPSRPRSRRKNHLRLKLPNRQLPAAPPPPSPSYEAIEPSSYDLGSRFLFLEGVETVEETFAASEASDALSSGASHMWFPGSVLALAARFAALFIVQTVVAIWFLYREDVKEVDCGGGNENGLKEKEKEKMAETGTVIEAKDFGRMVMEIREMAREAREREGREREAERIVHGGGIAKVGKRVGRKGKSITRIFMDGQGDGLVEKEDSRKLKLRGGVGYFPNAKGFGGSKPIRSKNDIDKGGIHQTAESNLGMESPKLCVPKKQNGQTCSMKKQSCEKKHSEMAPEKFPNLNNLHNSTERKLEKQIYTFKNSTLEGANDGDAEGLADKNINFPMVLTTRNGRPQSGLQNKDAESTAIKGRDNETMRPSHEKQWWLKLPYVFVILLHRSSENGDKGLYSLKTNSVVDDEKQPSYIIAFEDRGDAVNFSYILESFFGDLADVSADIVPLTTLELNELIKSGKRKLIVARKGQLRLYAGQPLLEVENSLRSLLQ